MTMVKSVLSNLPIYYMSLFKALVEVIKQIERIQCRFLWEGCSDTKKFHLVSWDLVKASRERGGLGVLDLRSMNLALLGKWTWRFGMERNAWWRNLMVIKCGRGRSDWYATWDGSPSGWSVWKWIVKDSANLWKYGHIDPGGGWVSFWFDFWVSGGRCLSDLFPRVAAAAQSLDALMCDLYSFVDRSWDIPIRWQLRGGAEAERLGLLVYLQACSPALQTFGPPSIVWHLETSGSFSVRSSARELIHSKFGGHDDFPSDVIWNIQVPTKVAGFLWQVAHGNISTIDNLMRRGLSIPNRCVMCEQDSESIWHLFWSCPFASQVWMFFSSRLSLLGPFPFGIQEFFRAWKGLNCRRRVRPGVQVLLHAILWLIWSERNNRIFRDKREDWKELTTRVAYRVSRWCVVGGSLAKQDLPQWLLLFGHDAGVD
ncbi:Putative ribonuclease H protein At1g65750 [Linum perenne]